MHSYLSEKSVQKSTCEEMTVPISVSQSVLHWKKEPVVTYAAVPMTLSS